MTLSCRIQKPTHSLGFTPDAQDSETKAFAALRANLHEEKAAWIAAHVEADVLSWAVRDLKISVDRFATQIPTLED
jgi:hypothetical protein